MAETKTWGNNNPKPKASTPGGRILGGTKRQRRNARSSGYSGVGNVSRTQREADKAVFEATKVQERVSTGTAPKTDQYGWTKQDYSIAKSYAKQGRTYQPYGTVQRPPGAPEPRPLSGAYRSRQQSPLPQEGLMTPLSPQEQTIRNSRPQNQGTFSAPFFSREGQRQRLQNVKNVYAIALNPFSQERIVANVENRQARKALEAVANNPYESALAVTGAVGIGRAAAASRGGVGLLRSTSAQVPLTNPVKAIGKEAAKKIKGSKAARLARGAGESILIGEGIRVGGEGLIRVSQPKEVKDLRRQAPDTYNEALRAAYGAEQQAVEKQPFLKRIAYELPLVQIVTGNKEAYQRGAIDILGTSNLTPKQRDAALDAIQRERSARSVTEAASLLGISARVERLGRDVITGSFGKAAKKGKEISTRKLPYQLFGRGFTNLLVPGAIEGGTQELVQQNLRKRDRDVKHIGIAAGAGAASAGILGGFIVAAPYAKKEATRSAGQIVEVGANIADPFEKPGDIVANIEESALKRLTGRERPKPTISDPVVRGSGVDMEKVVFLGTTPGKPARKGGRVLSSNPIEVLFGKNTPLNVPAEAPGKKPKARARVLTPTLPFTTDTFDYGGIPNILTDPTPIPVPEPIITPTETPSITPSENVFSQSFEQVINETPISIIPFAPLNTYSSTSQIRVPPPFPLSFDLFNTPSKSTKGKRRRYINELQAAEGLLGSLLGPAFVPPKKRKKKKKK